MYVHIQLLKSAILFLKKIEIKAPHIYIMEYISTYLKTEFKIVRLIAHYNTFKDYIIIKIIKITFRQTIVILYQWTYFESLKTLPIIQLCLFLWWWQTNHVCIMVSQLHCHIFVLWKLAINEPLYTSFIRKKAMNLGGDLRLERVHLFLAIFSSLCCLL